MAVVQVYDITKSVTSAIMALAQGLHSPRVSKQLGKNVLAAVKEHFVELNAERHHPWAKGIGYYADAARNTETDPTEEGFDIVTNKTGLRLRIEGGVVTPGKNPSCITGKPTQYLTIPAIAEAYGKTACMFGGLQFIRFGKDPDSPAALVEKQPKSAFWLSSGKKVRNVMKQAKVQGAFGRRVWFWLVKSATHKPDPTVVPDLDHLEDIAAQALEDYAVKTIEAKLS